MKRSGGRRPPRAVVLALAVLASACAGCDGGDPAARQAVVDASAKTLATGTARFAWDARTEPGRELDIGSHGTADFTAERSRGRFIYRSFPDVDRGSEVFYFADGAKLYFRAPGTREWVTEPGFTLDFGGSTDLPAAIRYFGSVTEGVRDRGQETVRGDDTTRYSGTVDLDRVAEEVPPEHRAAYRARIERFRISELPVEVWIDGEGLIRRVRYELELDALGVSGEDEERIVFVADIFDFGVPRPLKPPRPDRIAQK